MAFNFKFISFAFGLLLFGAGNLYAQQRLTLKKIDAEVTLDGLMNEPAWDAIPFLNPVQYEPIFNGEMSEITRFKIAYDENYFYAAAQLYTNDLSTITTNTLSRDQYSSDDLFTIMIDSFNDNQNGLLFATNPAGVRFDIAVSNDGIGGGGGSSPMNSSWNTFWDVGTMHTPEGWFAEIRIPFSSIGFQPDEHGKVVMGVILNRLITDQNERHIFPAIPPNWDFGMMKPSQAQDVELTDITSKKPLYITPYAIGGYSHLDALNEEETDYVFESEVEREIGLDMKYNLTGNLTLDVTVNTDFAQVEADDQQLNLTRFSLFFPEKRQFFQERGGLYEINLGRNRLFYSRRIGLDEDGNPVRILGGARMTGRIGNWDVGLLTMQTSESDSLPSENFGVLRLQRTTFNQLSKAGILLTTRLGADGTSNVVYAFDSETNVFSDHFLEIVASQTIDNSLDPDLRADPMETGIARISFTKINSLGFNYRFVAMRTGEEYEPGIGFIRRSGTTDSFVRLAYGWLAPEASTINRYSADIAWYTQSDNESLGLLDRSIFSRYELRFKKGGEISFRGEYSHEVLFEDDYFDLLDEIFIPGQAYKIYSGNLRYTAPESSKLQGQLSIEAGGIYDGDRVAVNFEPVYNVNTKLELGAAYTINALRFPNIENRNKTDFVAHLGQLKAKYAFNKKMSANTFVQYGNVAALVGANVRFRYNFREGRDLWIVLNEQVYTERNYQYASYTPLSQARTILVKYTHTFIF